MELSAVFSIPPKWPLHGNCGQSVKSRTVFGRIAAEQDVTAGAVVTDTITATIEF